MASLIIESRIASRRRGAGALPKRARRRRRHVVLDLLTRDEAPETGGAELEKLAPRRDTPLGTSNRRTIKVDARLTASAVSPAFTGFADMPPVFATAFLVGFVEHACVEAMKPFLQPGETTVGARVEINHCAATPIGLNVTTHVELLEVKGRRLRFVVLCWDDLDLVAEGVHDRVIVDEARFLAKSEKKAKRVRSGRDWRMPTAV